MIELTPADLPDALASMDTAPGITDAELRNILADCNSGQAIIERDDGAIWVRKPVALAVIFEPDLATDAVVSEAPVGRRGHNAMHGFIRQ